MTIAKSVSEVLQKHVVLEVEGIDRMYLNLYVPRLQTPEGVANYLRFDLGHRFASTVLLEPMTTAFVRSIERFAKSHGIALVTFEKGQRKDDVAADFRRRHGDREGVVFVGKAQEKAFVPRTERRRNPKTGVSYPWLVKTTAMVNHYYFYIQDEDFGPFFLKFCSYFPYTAKLCINGHEYVKRQLLKAGIPFEALDNGVLSCTDPKRLQELCDELSPAKIEGLLRKWLARLPHPFTTKDRRVGCRYEPSILQAEFSLTQVLDQPVNGRIFFEEVIRENLDLGRPSQVQLIFDDQRHPGLRYRSGAEESADAAADRLPSQPTSLGRPTDQPRLPSGRGRFSSGQPPRCARRSTRQRVAFCRSADPGGAYGHGRFRASTPGVHPSPIAGACERSARSVRFPGPHDLRSASSAPARAH